MKLDSVTCTAVVTEVAVMYNTRAAHHLNCPLDVDLAIESKRKDLVDDHVDHDEGSGAANPGRAVDNDRAGTI